jgi:hypothetical protein
MTANKGIKKHGQTAVDALYKEFAQLDAKGVFQPMHPNNLSHPQKRSALRAINLIKEKRDGRLKARTCADGRPERKIYTKEDTTSPAISTDSLFTILIKSAKEGRQIATWDIEGAYLLADQDRFVVVKFEGASVDILCEVNTDYKRFVVIENGKKVLYLRLLKALYGCLRSALLWYELYISILKRMGFQLNPYDHCVANKMIDGAQCTIGFWVDDNVASHMSNGVLDSVILELEKHVGKMVVSRGDTHIFLGMLIKFRREDNALSIDMSEYVKEVIADFPENVRGSAVNPARKDLFLIEEASSLLNIERSDIFHSLTMKLMYICQRGRVDVQTAVAFLSTRVSKSTEQDWSKLRRVVEFLNGTINDVMILGADSLDKLDTFVDVSFAVHHDMRSHTGGGVTFGRGVLMSRSVKQKLNTTSSTESEVVGAADYLPNTIWLMKFLECQGYKLKKSILHQDNESAIKLERNGKRSSSRRTRHIDIRYFATKDRLKTENIQVVYCPTETMVADYFTKPLQGALFKKLRAVIMGHTLVSTLSQPSPPTIE